MTPTLNGRMQTRVALLLTVGMLWTVVITPLLPRPLGAELGDVFSVTVRAILVTTVLGLGWELLYHWLQQLRWERDWPTLFGLLTGLPEGLVVWFVLRSGITGDVVVPGSAYLTHFATTWIIVWLWANGPMRVVFIRWRFRGGRLI